MSSDDFIAIVYQHYTQARRQLPWREPEQNGHFAPYKILISEVMLQQTQVSRVVPKYYEFLERFPDFKQLAQAELGTVLKLWSGLGYNRRAKFLWQTARQLVAKHGGQLPASRVDLVALPGIGTNTAGAILAYAFNQPVVFIETNIRSVFLHHFFDNADLVDDNQLLPFVAKTLDRTEPRQWYWALMDYGSYLKTTTPNPGRRSRHYVKQAVFAGSKRQLRGRVLQLLGEEAKSAKQLIQAIADERLAQVLRDLSTEQLISLKDGRYRLGG